MAKSSPLDIIFRIIAIASPSSFFFGAPVVGVFVTLGVVSLYLCYEFWPKIRTNPGKFLAIFTIVFLVPAVGFRRTLYPVAFAGNEDIPGISLHLIIRIDNKFGDGKHYVIDYGAVDGARMSLFLSPDRQLVFSVSDSQGKQASLSAPLGTDIPMDRFALLACEVGIKEHSTVLRVLLNGKQIRYIENPQKIEIASLDIAGGVLGGSLRGDQNAKFDINSLRIYSVTTNNANEDTLVKYFKSEPHIQYLLFNGQSWMRIRQFGSHDMDQLDPLYQAKVLPFTPEDREHFME